MVEKIILTILDWEEQKKGCVACSSILDNSPEYYRHFEELYLIDADAFERAICSITNISDARIYEYNIDKNSSIRKCSGLIAMHALRLQVYFGINISTVPQVLKDLYMASIELRKNNNWQLSSEGMRLQIDCLSFIEGLSISDDSPKSQLFSRSTIVGCISFDNFITLKEVDNIQMAVLYNQCYRFRHVTVCPTYLRQALRASWLYDHLITPEGWKLYFKSRSSISVYKDIATLNIVGFKNTCSLMNKIISTIDNKNIESKKEKTVFLNKLIIRFSNEIKKTLDVEKIGIIDSFLRNHSLDFDKCSC